MTTAFFITHPKVVVNRSCPVPRRHLADAGIARMRAFASGAILQNLSAVWSSDETKAIEAAGILAARFGLPVHVSALLHENDRSATGFLPPDEFEKRLTRSLQVRRSAFKDGKRPTPPNSGLPMRLPPSSLPILAEMWR